MLTLGELVLRRKLEKTESSNYMAGQLAAVAVGDDTAILSWVDEQGGACQVFCFFDDDYDKEGEWVTHPQLIRISLSLVEMGEDVNYVEVRALPKSFALSPERTAAIEAAQKKGRRAKKQPDAPGS